MRWFLPGETPRPAHLPPLAQTGEVSVLCGPTGEEGRIVGGTYQPDEAGWLPMPGGWWINGTDSQPQHLLRLDARDGTEIAGADPGHRWLIPALFRPTAGGLVWAGEQRWTPAGWGVQPPPEPWLSIGLRLHDPITQGTWDELGDDGVAELALALLCCNYHLVPDELAALGWMSKPMSAAAFAGCLTDGA